MKARGKTYEVAIVGNIFDAKRWEFNKYYLPDVFFSGGKQEGELSLLDGKLVDAQTTIYVCRDKICKRPVTSVSFVYNQGRRPDSIVSLLISRYH